MTDVTLVKQFLKCETPKAWLNLAVENKNILLIDHARCEKKAASTALSLMFRYPDKNHLLVKLSRLAREELRHFEQVYDMMQIRSIEYVHLTASRYASQLRKEIRQGEPLCLVDTLIVGAYIEARSCERFFELAPLFDETDPELSKYYRFLLKSEQRHFQDYLQLAETYTKQDITSRVTLFGELEAELIQSKDEDFRFHSGVL